MPEPDLRLVIIGGSNPAELAHVLDSLSAGALLAAIAHCTSEPLAPALRRAPMRVVEITDTKKIEPGHIYVVPHDANVGFRDREVSVEPTTANNTLDVLFRAAADHFGARCIGVVLAGQGTSGSLGIKRIKEVGGITLAQAEVHGEQSEMPRSALASGMVDLALPLPDLALRIEELAEGSAEDDKALDATTDTLRDILTLVRVRSGHDFSAYKRATLFRRVSRRMQVCQRRSITEYHQYLRDHPAELVNLLRDFLIGVTNFFRDRDAFEGLAVQVIPKLFANKQPGEQVRVWVPGCATGEEAYSIAMLLAEHAERQNAPQPVQVFATDIDEESLAEARQGRYPESIVVDVGEERLARFFTRDNGYYRVNKELRETVLFSPHSLLRDPPFSRLDLVSCRNVLIYLNREAQDRVLHLFHFGLRTDGYLFLGSSESADNSSLYSTIDSKLRIFQRRLSAGSDLEALATRWQALPIPQVAVRPQERTASLGDLHFRLVEHYAPPSVLVDADLDVLHVSERAGRYLAVSGGEPTKQLLRLVLPPLRVDLRTAIYAARQPGRGTESRLVRFDDGGTPRTVELRVVANALDDIAPGAALVMFDEKAPGETAGTPPGTDPTMEPVVREIEDELHRTREQLRTTIEQYETSLEEIKASNEELQAINEELRSATEELETSKEELQSVNEELTTLNHELKAKIDEVSHANSDLQNLMTSTDIGVLFLDRQLHIKRFTPRAQDLFNVIATDLGRPLVHLTHRLENDDLVGLARETLQTLRTTEREVSSKDGRQYLMRLLPYRSLDDRIEGVVVTFVEVTPLREAIEARRVSEAALEANKQRLRLALLVAPTVIFVVDRDGTISAAFALGRELSPAAAHALFAAGDSERLQQIAREVLTTRTGTRAELDLVIDGTTRTYDFRVEPNANEVNAVGFDITQRKQAESNLIDADRRKDEFLATLSHELRNPLTPLKVALDVARLADDRPQQRKQSLEIIGRQVGLLEQLVDDLLDLSRIAQGKIELRRVPVDVSAIIEAALETTRPLFAQHGHEVEVTLAPELPKVEGDPARLTQVVVNLLTNAAKYTPDNGRIWVAARAERGSVRISIRDNGIGIPPRMLPRIFDIFVQLRDPSGRAQGGLGIGLNLVKRLVELHGGTVAAFSEGPGHGSELVIDLPAAAL